MTRWRHDRMSVGWAALIVAIVALPTSAQVLDWPSSKPPVAGASRPASFPPNVARTLPNGLRVVVVPQHEQPVVCVQILVRAGSVADGPGKGGLAGLTAALLTRGTATRSAADIADAVDTAGAELTTSSGVDAAFVQMTVLRDSLEAGLALLAEIVGQPSFPVDELERQRARTRSALVRSSGDPQYLASVVLDRVVFDGHPYGLPADGTPQSVGALTRDDVVAFHRRFYAPNNAILAVVGDVDVEAALGSVGRMFGPWQAREVPPLAGSAGDVGEPRSRVVVIDKADSPVAEIRGGQRAPTRRDAATVATDVATRILGGEGGNRLLKTLRTQRRLTLDAGARYDTYLRSGVLRASTFTVPQGAGEGAKVIADVLTRLQRDGVDEDELQTARTFVRGSYPMSLETPGAISTKVLTAMFHEVPFRQVETYAELVDGLTVTAVNAALRSLLTPDRLTTVVVGPAPPIVSALRTAGFKDIEVIAAEDLDLAAPTLERPAPGSGASGTPPLAAGTSPEEWPAAREVLDRAARAAGGLDALRQIETLSATARTTLYLPTGPVRAETKTLIQYPNRLRVDAVTPRGLVVQAFDAGHAWIWEERGQRDAPPAMQREFDAALRRDWVRLIVDAMADRIAARRLADETTGAGRTLQVVELWGAQLAPCRLAFDAVTGRLERLVYETAGPYGQERMSETYSDFRQIGGVLMPFRAVVRRDDAPVLDRAVLELKVNPVLQPGAFVKPK